MEKSDESQLTQEEIDAIAEEFSDKGTSIINPSSSTAQIRSHDLQLRTRRLDLAIIQLTS